MLFFKAYNWPSDHMISSRPLISQPTFLPSSHPPHTCGPYSSPNLWSDLWTQLFKPNRSPDSLSLKIKDLFWIVLVNPPRMGGVPPTCSPNLWSLKNKEMFWIELVNCPVCGIFYFLFHFFNISQGLTGGGKSVESRFVSPRWPYAFSFFAILARIKKICLKYIAKGNYQ